MMSPRFSARLLGAAAFTLLLASGMAKPVTQFDFEDGAQFEALRALTKQEGELLPDTRIFHSGKQALLIHPTLLGGERATIPLPTDFTRGRISFWFYDPAFDEFPTGSRSRAGWSLNGTQLVEGKPKAWDLAMDNYRSDYEWAYSNGSDSERARSGIRRHKGWAKFDIVVRGEGTNRLVIVSFDGVEALRFPVEGFVAKSLSFRSFWGAADITVDDIVVDDDPDSFRPSAVQGITAGDDANNVALAAGQPLPLNLKLDPKGAGAPKGTISVEFLDLREKSVGKVEVPVDWATVKDATLSVPITFPLQSRHYWVRASYRDEGVASCDTMGRINVQYLVDPRTKDFRAERELAGQWDWLPATGKDPASPPADWAGASRVKNLWYSSADRRNKDVTASWYRRAVEIPKDWNGRRILLRIEQPHNTAKVFLNGVAAGEVVWPGGDVDLTGKVKPGQKADLAILVDGAADAELTKALTAALGKGASLPEQFQNEARGLGGEVSLVAEPMGAKIDGVVISPRLSDMSLGLEFSTAGLSPGKSYVIEGDVSRSGRSVKPFKSEPFKAGSSTVKITIPWPDAELWDLGKPNLYDLDARLVVGGKAVDAMWPERFGFREVKFEGRLVTINGNPVNLFMPMPSDLAGNFGVAESMERNHLNFLSDNHHNIYAGQGSPASVLASDHYALCSEAGFGSDLGVSSISLRKYLVNFYAAKGGSLLDDPVYWDSFQRVLDRGIHRYGNQPGLFFLLGGGNGGQLEMGNMMNPAKMDGLWLKRFAERPVLRQLLEVEQKAKAMVNRADPRKPTTGQDAGNFHDAIHITHYAGFMPIQEFIESDEYWLKYGTKPYMITEQAAPFTTDWTTGSRLGHNSPSRFGVVAERAAALKGDAAFHRQPVDQDELNQFEQRCAGIRKGDPNSKNTMTPPLGPLYAYERNSTDPSVYHDVNYELAREQWLNWRAEGLGLLCYWGGLSDGRGQAALDFWTPLTGYLAGNAARRTDKTHILKPGETWDRQFLVLNNRRDPAQVECQWTASLDGKEIASGTEKIEVPAGGHKPVPILVKIPESNQDGSGILSVKLLENGKQVAADHGDFQILAPSPAPKSARVALIDPEGKSAEALDRIGVKYQKLQFNADLSGYDVVIFGRRAFSSESKILAQPLDLGALLAAGKRVLILEQDAEVLRNRFKFRVESPAPRSMFGRISGHPVTAGLPDSALNFWRGAATLTDGYEAALTQTAEPEMNGARMFTMWNDGKEHPRQMKWGNNHNVATVVIQKPDRGNFRTLVDAEFGLDYATVMEVDEGQGKLLFCQADISGRTAVEPAAERLLSNMVSYLGTAQPAAWSTGVAYLGADRGADLLDRLRVGFRKIESPDAIKPGEVLVLGDGLSAQQLSGWKDAIARFVENGGVCFSLPRKMDEWKWLPFDVAAKDSLVDATIIDKPKQPLLAGLSNGELYYPGRLSVVALEKLPESAFSVDTGVLAEVPFGKGRYVFCQISPDSFDTDVRFYLEFARKRTYRLIQTLLNNLGVPMTAPSFLEQEVKAVSSTEKRPPLDIANMTWEGIKVAPDSKGPPAANDPGWKSVKVPGYINDQRPEWDDRRNFVFWYRVKFNLAEIPASSKPTRLQIGAIDDEDDIWFNGTLIGHTGRDTNVNDWLLAPRYYSIAPSLLRKGENEILIRVVNLEGKCGIPSGPLRLNWGEPDAIKTELSLVNLAGLPPLNLSNPNWKVLVANEGETALPADTDSRWRNKNLPDTKIVTDTANRTAWCYRDFDVPEIPAGARPVLMIGAVDDEDETFINGKKIGETNKQTNPKNYYSAPRVYPIPAGVLKQGKNRILIKAINLNGAGSLEGPVQISWLPPDEAAKLRLSVAPYLFEVDRLSDPYWWVGGW